jgi:c-di-GMP-binding flagellar brake protein YcgR
MAAKSMYWNLTQLNIQTLELSQFETSLGQWIPHLILLLLITAGLAQIKLKKKYRGKKSIQRSERRKISIPILINTPITHEISINTYDISLTGAFFEHEDLKKTMTFTSLIGQRTGIKSGDIIDIKIYISRFKNLNCQARVVRYNLQDLNHPPLGIGIEFLNLSYRKKKLLASFIYSDAKLKTS